MVEPRASMWREALMAEVTDAVRPAIVGRMLPDGEWPRLEAAGFGVAWKDLNPDFAGIAVVEVDGQIVAQWMAMTTTRVEGLHIAEAFRGHAGIARALLATMVGELAAQGLKEVLTQVADPAVEQLCVSAGGHALPGRTWVLPVGAPR